MEELLNAADQGGGDLAGGGGGDGGGKRGRFFLGCVCVKVKVVSD